MREVVYHRNAARYLKRMPADRKEQVKSALADISTLVDVLTHPGVRAMKGEWDGCFRLYIGRFGRESDQSTGEKLAAEL